MLQLEEEPKANEASSRVPRSKMIGDSILRASGRKSPTCGCQLPNRLAKTTEVKLNVSVYGQVLSLIPTR